MKTYPQTIGNTQESENDVTTKLLYKKNDGLEVLIEDANGQTWVVFYQDNKLQYFIELGTFKNIVKMFQYGYLAKDAQESEE